MNKNELQRLVKVETRLDGVCKKLDSLRGKVDKLMENHLPHIRQEIAELKTEVKVNSVKVAAIVGLLSVVGSAIINYFF